MRVLHHGQSTVHLAISNCIFPTKKTGIITGVLNKPHARQHHRCRPTTPKNLHYYQLFKNMNIAIKNFFVANINDQWIKGSKYMVMGNDRKSFILVMNWTFVRYGKITPRYLMNNQNGMKVPYNV